MAPKFIILCVSFLFTLVSLKAEFTKEKYLIETREDSSPEALGSLQDIHNFQLTFDDYSLGGIAYEPFEVKEEL